MAKKMNPKTVSDEEIIELFEPAFEQQVGTLNDITTFECSCKRSPDSKGVQVEVVVTGMAGCPTPDDFKEMKLKDIDVVVIEREDKGSLKFKLLPKETISLNTNDYVVLYQSV